MRVLSLCPVATELVCSLGAAHLLVGRTDDCLYPDAARTVPSIGKAVEASIESVAVFEPDIVFVGPERDLVAPEGAKWNVVRVDPETLDDVYSLIAAVGAVLEKRIEADIILHELRAELSKLHDACARFHATRVYCERSGGLRVPTYVREIIAIAGGDAYSGSADIEPLAAFDPQMIIALVTCDDERYAEIVMSRHGWSALKAIKTERLFVVQDALLRPTPRLIDGARLAAKLLHGVSA